MEINFEASPPQQKFLTLNTRYRAFIGGVGSGKTYAGALHTLITALNHPNSTGLVGGITYPMLRDVIVPIVLEIIPETLIKTYTQNPLQLELINGSKILFRSLENDRQIDRIRGLNLNWFWIDEAPYLPEYAFKVLQGRLRKGEGQTGVITGTPKGFNWVYERFIKDPGENYSAIAGISSDSNPFLPPEYLSDLQSDYTGEFLKQEYYGLFVKFEGLVYLEFLERDHLDPRNPGHLMSRAHVDDAYYAYKYFIYGYDSGQRNPRVLLKIGVTHDDRYVVMREWYRRGVALSRAVPDFKKIYQPPGRVYCDSSAAGDIAELRLQGFKAQPASKDVLGGIQLLKRLFLEGRLLVCEDLVFLRAELNTYRWNDERDEPVKESDHALDALRYALGGVVRGGRGRPRSW